MKFKNSRVCLRGREACLKGQPLDESETIRASKYIMVGMDDKLLNKIAWCPYRLTQKERKKWEEEKALPSGRRPAIKYKINK